MNAATKPVTGNNNAAVFRVWPGRSVPRRFASCSAADGRYSLYRRSSHATHPHGLASVATTSLRSPAALVDRPGLPSVRSLSCSSPL